MKILFTALRGALGCALAIVGSGCFSAPKHVLTRWPQSGAPMSDREVRAFMNAHIIAIDRDGFAIEPYDYLYKQKPPGDRDPEARSHVTRLQTHLWGLDTGHPVLKTNVLSSLGLPAERIREMAATSFTGTNPFIFRDIVVPNILEAARTSGATRVTLYVHGGMNTIRGAISRAEMMLINQMAPQTNDSYPIFICWPSSMPSAYWQHLTRVRNGVDVRKDKKTWKRVSIPLYLLTDVGTSIVRGPRAFFDLTRAHWKGARPNHFGQIQDAKARYYAIRYAREAIHLSREGNWITFQEWRQRLQPYQKDDLQAVEVQLLQQLKWMDGPDKLWDWLVENYRKEWQEISLGFRPQWHPMTVSMGEHRRSFGDEAERLASAVVAFPIQFALASALGATGSESWSMMSRRVDSMYHHETSFRPGYGAAPAGSSNSYEETNPDVRDHTSTGVGAMAVFLRGLDTAQKDESRKLTKDVEIYGHSMGAMVLNRGLREFPEINYSRIVYMAAACTMKDFQFSVVPYLSRKKTNDAPTYFYNLCLNPRAEERERPLPPPFHELTPRGSLLLWLDEFLRRPESFQDRVMGNFENAILASRSIPPSVQGNIQMTAMPAGPFEYLGGLQSHGSFNDYRFWEPGFVEGEAMQNREAFRLRPVCDGRLQ